MMARYLVAVPSQGFIDVLGQRAALYVGWDMPRLRWLIMTL